MGKLTENAEIWGWVAFLDVKSILIGIGVFSVIMIVAGILVAVYLGLIP